MSNNESGVGQKVLWRIKKDGVFKTTKYALNRASIYKDQQLAEKEVLTWNDQFFEKVGVDRSLAENLLEETSKKIPVLDVDVHVKSQKPQSTHLLAFTALKVAILEQNLKQICQNLMVIPVLELSAIVIHNPSSSVPIWGPLPL